jgi:putative spermidine/putrescine transport system ATP-binding protein
MKRRKVSISLKNLSMTFQDGTKAVQDVSLEIKGGETIALVGPSGCGKTTTLRIIGGLEKNYQKGEVWFDDRRMDEIPTEQRNIGIVFQSYALFPNMNVFENVAFGLKVRKVQKAEIEKKVLEVLSLVSISELRNKSVTELSGGQRQRVALARALTIEPDVLLLDEPLTALDAKMRDKLRIELDSLLKQLQITTVFVTHDQTEAMALGDRIAVMKDGKVCQVGTPMEIYKNPNDLFVATFIGTNNAFYGKIVKNGRIASFYSNGITMTLSENLQLKNDETVWILFRPEDTQLSTPDKGQISATVKNIFFLGEKIRISCSTGINSEIIVDLKGKERISLGERVHLTVPPESLFVIRNQQSQS